MAEQEQEQGLNIGQYVQMIRHRKWWLISGLFVGWVVVSGVSWVIPPRYRSEALVLVERQQVNDKLVTPNTQTSLQQRLDAMTQRVLSRSQLKTIIERDGLYTKQRRSMTIDDVIDQMRKDIGIDLVTADKRKADELTGFKVSYTAPTARMAQQVTGELVGLFINENLVISKENSTSATQFFESQLNTAKTALDVQELKLQNFKSRNLGALPEQLQSNLQILTGLQGRLQAANDALSRAQQQQTYLQSLQSQYHSSDDATDASNAPPSIDRQLTDMKAQLAALKAKYTDQHPDVVRLQQNIVALEALKKKMGSDPKDTSSTPDMGLNSLAQVKSQLKANELEIANRKKDVKAIESDIANYQGRLNQTPAREQELAGIIRDHEQSLSNYNSLLAKKQQSELASNLVSREQGEQFRLVDPASLPQNPDFPDHFKFSLGGIGAGLALGLLLTFVREMTNQSIYTDQQALAIVKAPVLTAVPNLWTVSEQNQQKRSAMLQTIAASLLVALIPIGTLLAFLHG